MTTQKLKEESVRDMFIQKVQKFLYRELSYDGDADTICPYCKKIIKEGSRYLYHYESMAGNLATRLGFTGKLAEATTQFFIDREYTLVTGKRKRDSQNFAEELYSYLYE